MSQVYFKKEGMTNYMIIPCEYELAEDYQSCLLKHHTIPYFLQYEKRELNGKQSLYYRLKYRTSLESVLGHLQLTYFRLENILASIVGVMETTEEYLLEPDRIIWKTDRIFLEADTGKLQFCYCPMEEEEKGSLKDLLMKIIQAVDKREEESVLFILQFYNMVTEPDYELEDLKHYISTGTRNTRTDQGEEAFAEEEEFWTDKPLGNCVKDAPLEENPDIGKMESRYNNHRNRYGKHQRTEIKKESVKSGTEEEDRETKAEKAVCILLIVMAGINFILIVCLLLNILTYDCVRYLFISMGGLIVLTIIYMHMSKEENPDEIMQAFFEDNSDILNDKELSKDEKEQLALQESGKKERFRAECKNLWDNDSGIVTCGETTVLTSGDVTDQNKEVIVTEDYTTQLYLESMEKGKYEPVHLNKRSIVLGAMPDSCDYILRARGVSRMHAKLMGKPDGIYLLDLNSTNGTYLNGELIESGQDYKLEEGDMVTFALCEFYVTREKIQR